MPYRVRVEPRLTRTIPRLGVSDAVEGAVYMFLHQDLPRLAPGNLVRLTDPFDGMCCRFYLIDPQNRMMQHQFTFQVLFGMDEETLFVVNAAYLRGIGF